MRLIITLGSLLLAVPAAAMPFGTDWFRDAKTGYRVEISHSGGVMLLDGRKPHARFHLAVAPDGHVTGVFEGRPVDYVIGAAAPATLVADSGR